MNVPADLTVLYIRTDVNDSAPFARVWRVKRCGDFVTTIRVD